MGTGGTVMIATSYGSSTIVSDGPTASPPAGPVLPDFSEPIRNVTVPLGREAVLSCVISNLAEYKVCSIHCFLDIFISLRLVITPIALSTIFYLRNCCVSGVIGAP